MTQLEPASFEVERFELAGDACLEVRGRWFGVRGRRFMRPTLTAVAGGREQRLLAVLDHKPWIAEEGETWHAAFPCSTDPAALLEAELTVAPDVTVPLPPPSSPPAGRRPRAGSRRSPVRERETAVGPAKPDSAPRGDGGAHDSSPEAERRAALRSRDEALSELGAVERDRERLRRELRETLASLETASAERHDAIEAEVSLRIADLRAEAERERAAAGLAAQIASERDTARDERAEAIRERDEAHAERDAARRERNRMLAHRDTARTLAREATRHWEATAELGTRRTQERDAVASERDRAAHERDAAREALDRATCERDAAREERDRAAGDRDLARQEGEQALHEQAGGQAGHAVTQVDLEAQPAAGEQAPGLAGTEPTERKRVASEAGSAARAPGGLARPSTPTSRDTDPTRRPRWPPTPTEPRVGRNIRDRGEESSSIVRPGRPPDPAGMWRARVLAIAGLLIALVILVVMLTSK
ncbi:MAG: hypothetical protein JWN81_961 [Solirubrobacterales bacterium]|nr:hypothetical protein [Solirubrobacterales bacterium]